MHNQDTGELEIKLERISPQQIEVFLQENADEMLENGRDFMIYMNKKLKEKNLLKKDVIMRADINQGYGYKLLTEEKITRQRDVILRLCYASEFSLEETQYALRLYRMETLYARDARDALIMACFNDRPGNIINVNELLLRNNMMPLRSSGVVE